MINKETAPLKFNNINMMGTLIAALIVGCGHSPNPNKIASTPAVSQSVTVGESAMTPNTHSSITGQSEIEGGGLAGGGVALDYAIWQVTPSCAGFGPPISIKNPTPAPVACANGTKNVPSSTYPSCAMLQAQQGENCSSVNVTCELTPAVVCADDLTKILTPTSTMLCTDDPNYSMNRCPE